MSQPTTIEWTHQPGYQGVSWNPTRGCNRISPACKNCYAERIAVRFCGDKHPVAWPDRMSAQERAKHQRKFPFWRFAATGGWTGRVELIESKLLEPLRWRKPRCVFVDSMSDLFHEALTVGDIFEVWKVMYAAARHRYLILTKRAERMAEVVPLLMREFGEPLDNVWLGVSVEDKANLCRVDHLRRTLAAVRFVSLEPQLEDLGKLDLTGIDWVVQGGESGPGARPIKPEWVRGVRDQCIAANVAYFFKQWGEWAPVCSDAPEASEQMVRMGKNLSGATVDGAEWRQFPEARA